MTPGNETAAGGIRERNRAAIEGEILRLGHLHLAEHGAAALSLRAIARDLGMASSALYRYVASRDELLTLLIVDAFNSLADEVDADLASLPARRRSPGQQFRAISVALRRWALANPHEFALIYGSPVPDYRAPEEQTNEPGTRVVRHLARLLSQSRGKRRGENPAVSAAGRQLAPVLADPMFDDLEVEPNDLVRGLAAWSLVVGAVTAEVFEQNGPNLSLDPGVHFEAMVALANSLVFERD